MTETPHPIWSGSFHIFGVEVKCHTLSNGQRIIEQESVLKLLDAMGDPVTGADTTDVEAFAKWKTGNAG